MKRGLHFGEIQIFIKNIFRAKLVGFARTSLDESLSHNQVNPLIL